MFSMKFSKEITLAVAPYKTIKLGVSEADSMEQCDKELMKELNRLPEIKKLNEAEIKKAVKNE